MLAYNGSFARSSPRLLSRFVRGNPDVHRIVAGDVGSIDADAHRPPHDIVTIRGLMTTGSSILRAKLRRLASAPGIGNAGFYGFVGGALNRRGLRLAL